MFRNISLTLLGWVLLGLSVIQAQTAQMESIQQPDTLKKIKTEKEKPEWKTRYIKKLTQVSPRVHYGWGNYTTRMSYQVPDIDFAVSSAINELKNKYPWAPWKKVSIQPDAEFREKINEQKGKFFTSAGINLPLIFIDIEASVGRYSQPIITMEEVWPVWKKVGEQSYSELLEKRVTTPRAKASLTGRIGIELERLLPDHLQPRFQFGPIALGLDMSTYYVMSADFSYRVGLEAIAPDAAAQVQKVFEPVPIVSEEKKREAAVALVGHIESKIPSYFWAPAMHGIGISGKGYLDIGKAFSIRNKLPSRIHEGDENQSGRMARTRPSHLDSLSHLWHSIQTISIILTINT